jgi:methyl-accepting chemotaxis protein
MAILGNLKITTVALVGSLLLAGAAVGSAAMVLTATQALGSRLAYSAENTVPSLQLLSNVRTTMTEARLSLNKQVISSSEPELRQYREATVKQIGTVDAALVTYRSMVSDDAERAIYDKVLSRWADYKTAAIKISRIPLTQRAEAAAQAVALAPTGNAAVSVLNEDIAYNVQLSKTANAEAKAAVGTFKFLSIMLILFSLTLAAGIVLLFRHRLSAPLTKLIDAMQEMAGGNIDRAIPGEDLTDEVGDIGRALASIKLSVAARSAADAESQMAVQRKVVGELGEGLSALKAGRLTASINEPFPGEYERLRADFNDALATMADLIRQLADTAHSVNNGANEISSAASDLAMRTERQASSLAESSAAVRNLNKSASGTAKTATDANALARSAQNSANGGGDSMTQTVAAMNQIAESSRRMEEIVGIIEGLAFQTNLLALNAGVEAARAGEAGRGFAVVATEVRALAQRSTDAAKDIGNIIQSSGRDVVQGVTMIGQTQTALTEIVASTQELSEMIESIAVAARDQSATITQVSSVVEDMDRSTQQNAALVEQSSAAARSLLNQAEAMNELVGRFEFDAHRTAPLRRAA